MTEISSFSKASLKMVVVFFVECINGGLNTIRFNRWDDGEKILEPYMDLRRSTMSNHLPVDVAAAKILALIEENATRACFELVQSRAWDTLVPPTGRHSPEM